MHRVTILLAFVAPAAVAGCGGSAPPEPTASISAYTPESLDPADDRADDLALTVDYEDGNGDLGGGIATIHDCRVPDLVTTLEIPPIASQEGVDHGISIKGQLVVTVADIDDVTPGIPPQACAELGAPQLSAGEVAFCVVLTDAAGLSGAGDCTAAIPIAQATARHGQGRSSTGSSSPRMSASIRLVR